MLSWRLGVDEYESVKLLGAVVMEEEIPTLFQEGQGKSRDIDGGCGVGE